MKIVFKKLAFALAVLGFASCSSPDGTKPREVESTASGWRSGTSTEVKRSPKVEIVPLSDAELALLPRDQRRTKIIEGFTCERLLHGQAFYFKFLPGGIGLVGMHEGERSWRWSVENDKFCMSGNYFQDSCDDLPKRDLPNEREWLLGALGKSCL